MSDNYCIPFIKQEDFENHVAQTIKTYNTTLKSIDLAKFNSNIIDPIKLTFDKALFRKSIEDIIELEIHRQRDKSNTNAIGYAVTHEYTDFGECYDFLYISDYEEEWDEMLYKQGRTFYAYAYVWNKTDDCCSEFGTIGVCSFGGGIKRVA